MCAIDSSRVAEFRFLRIGSKSQSLLTNGAHDAQSAKVWRFYEVGVHIFNQKTVTNLYRWFDAPMRKSVNPVLGN